MGARVDYRCRYPKQRTIIITQNPVCYTIGSSKACRCFYLDILIIFYKE